ncbi:MAG: aldo/keto reductase, partial [Gammaproteobacteria bacterium]|nr:aldo/keto reductase [Gammaproteobacteria bacterium]
QHLVKRGLRLVSNQVKYSLMDRAIERNGILQTARELGITIIAYSPLEMGL